MEGRFAVISVHMFLVLERIRVEGAKGDELARALLETLVTDIDDNMREIGIGDMGVPRRVKKAAAALHEQIEVYKAAIAESSDTQLSAAIARYIVGQDAAGQPSVIAAYVRQASSHLAQLSWGEIEAGRITFAPF
jgi:cytochrome b pre-mRNA-processing protein 3